MNVRSQTRDMEELLRQEREYTNSQVEQIRREFEEKLEQGRRTKAPTDTN